MEKVRVEDAVGMVLCHDITEIVPGKFKGRAFAKGHIIEEKDIEKLLDLGKRHIYVWDLSKGYVHENDAALRMVQAAAGDNITFSEVKEGKIELRAACDGVLHIDLEALYELNSVDEICFSTIHGNKMVTKGKLLGGARVIPLAVREEILTAFENVRGSGRYDALRDPGAWRRGDHLRNAGASRSHVYAFLCGRCAGCGASGLCHVFETIHL